MQSTFAEKYPLTIVCDHCGSRFFPADLRLHQQAMGVPDGVPRFGMQTREGHTHGASFAHLDDDWDPRVDSGGRQSDHPDFGRDWPRLRVPTLRDVAIYLNGLAVASIIMTVGWLNPSWPAWTGGVAVVIAVLAGLIATQPDSR